MPACSMRQMKQQAYFVVGMVAGLWVALGVVPAERAQCAGPAPGPVPAPLPLERRAPAAAPSARALQRPRYYTTELGMRGSLMVGVLSSAAELERAAALNRSLARLQPALKFFITATAPAATPLSNVVGFTDSREMLKPFHALKYLADNYLEEYDFFFLATDRAFINARRLAALAARLSVSRDVYMGTPAPGSEYCALDGGVLLSNSVLRALHAELDWCVRNSYSPHHHENLGRCVLHAAHVRCRDSLQGERFLSPEDGPDAAAAVGDAVSVRGVATARLPALRALAARAELRRGAAEARKLAARLRRGAGKHPPHYRNVTWPAGLRRDPGLRAPPPDDRFSHLRWTLFNESHAFMPDELRAAAPLDRAHKEALEMVMEHVRAWCARAWGAADVRLVEGARQWEPAAALRYRLLLRADGAGGARLRRVEAARALGAARLVPVRYVTESARAWLLLPVRPGAAPEAAAFLARYERTARADNNTRLAVVWLGAGAADARLAAGVEALRARSPAGAVRLLAAGAAGAPAGEPAPERPLSAREARAVLAAVDAPPDALLLLVPPHLEFNQDFLNRARMNCIPGESWFLPVPFARHAQFAHPAFRAPTGTGRFPAAPRASLLAVTARDAAAALRAWRGDHGALEAALAASALRCVRAPEPGAVLRPRAAPCPPPGAATRAACLRRLRAAGLRRLDLGARHMLAQLLLETQARLH